MSFRPKIVFVPRWLSRVAEELKISNTDLLDLEKLSCILSKRDVELYRMANDRLSECLQNLCRSSAKDINEILTDFSGSSLAVVSLDQRAAYSNVSRDTLIYGATATNEGEGPGIIYGLRAQLGDQDTVLLTVTLGGVGTSSTLTLAQALAEALHGTLVYEDFVRSAVFKQYVRDLQIN